MSSSLMLNGRGKGSLTEPKTQAVLLSDDNSTARVGRAVVESHENIQLLIIRNRYLLDFLRQALSLPIVYDYVVRCRGVDNTVEKRGHLKIEQSKAISGYFVFRAGDARSRRLIQVSTRSDAKVLLLVLDDVMPKGTAKMQ